MRQEKRTPHSVVRAIVALIQALCVVGVFLGLGLAFLGQLQTDSHGSLELTVARGAQVHFSISAGGSIHGLWAAPGGIQVELRNDAIYYSQFVEVMKPTALALGYDLTDVNDQRLDATTIPIDFTLPNDIPGPAMQTLQGEITNYVFLAVPAASGQYEIVESELAVSLKIHLVLVEPALDSMLDYIRYHAAPFGFGLVAIAILAFVADTIIGAVLPSRLGAPDVAALKVAADSKGLLRALRYKKDASVRRTAALALGEIHSYPALRPLMGALRDQDSEVRIAAAHALAEIGDGRATAALSAAAATGESAGVREAATAALARLPKQ